MSLRSCISYPARTSGKGRGEERRVPNPRKTPVVRIPRAASRWSRLLDWNLRQCNVGNHEHVTYVPNRNIWMFTIRLALSESQPYYSKSNISKGYFNNANGWYIQRPKATRTGFTVFTVSLPGLEPLEFLESSQQGNEHIAKLPASACLRKMMQMIYWR